MKASDLLLKCLHKQGVTAIYGVPGEENADIMISLLDSPIKFFTTRHEQTASMMAEMHGRLKGIPGVCLATLGPGATNLITGVAQANMDNSPLVAIIGQAETSRLHKQSHQNMHSVDMYKSVTKWSTTIRDADSIPETIAKAFKVAMEGNPGAVLVELPEDIAKCKTSALPIDKIQLASGEGTTSAYIKAMLALLAKSKKPIMLVGDAANRTECDKELAKFLKHTNLYCATTFMGKGTVSDKYPRSLHTVGMGMKDIAVEAFDAADLVICVGYDMVEWPPAHWNAVGKKKIIHINIETAEVDSAYIPTIEMVGDLPTLLKQINQDLKTAHIKEKPVFAKIQAKINEDLGRSKNYDGFPMTPVRILNDIRHVLRDHDMLVSDVGAHKMWVARHYEAYHSKTCFISNGFCSTGGSMPGALEAKRLHPKKHVVALCGDGGFLMSIQALVTAARYKIPIVVVVWQDGDYGLIKWKQEMHYKTFSHVALHNPNLAQLATGLGCYGEQIESTEEFVPTLKNALKRTDKPSVIIVPVDYSQNMKLFKHLHKIVSKPSA